MGIRDLQTVLDAHGENVDLFRAGPPEAPLALVLDAEGCPDRLYGGYFSDWACGGQWARCVQFLSTLSGALNDRKVSICVCFDGSHPTPADPSSPTPPIRWQRRCAIDRQKINNVLRHVASKGTPPPKVWWVPPVGLQSCLRSALRQMKIPMMVTADDHHQEVIGLCRERGYAGLIGCSGEYVAFQPPRYFSGSQLKLTYRQSLETKEFMMPSLGETLNVPKDRICIMAALLGNTVLTEQHLIDFHKRISTDQKKFGGEALVQNVCAYVSDLSDVDLDSICVDVFGDIDDSRCALFKQCVQYYVNGTKEGFLKYKTAAGKKIKSRKGLGVLREVDSDIAKLADGNDAANDSDANGVSENKNSKVTDEVPGSSQNEKESVKTITPIVPVEVLRTCSERHSKGFMSPLLLNILTHRQITFPVLLEDENHRDIPSIHHLYRPIRQNVYAIVYNLHHHSFMAKRNQKEGEKVAYNVVIAEWIYTKQNPGKVAEMVPAVMLDWPVPTVKRLWFGSTIDDRGRRLRAFLTCMKSDVPIMLNTFYVPEPFLMFACVLRFIISTSPLYIRRHELDAFIATAFSNDLRNPLHLQEMTLPTVNGRGVQLGALLMAGIENAILANDACGAPLHVMVSSPWSFFDGKLFQHKLAKAYTSKSVLQLCDNQLDIVYKVENLRKAILDGLNVELGVPIAQFTQGMFNVYPPPSGVLGIQSGSRNRMALGPSTHRSNDRAQLEIAGVVVGHWGPNYSRSNHSTRFNSEPMGYAGRAPHGLGNQSRHRPIMRNKTTYAPARGISRKTRHRPTRITNRKKSDSQNTVKSSPLTNGKNNEDGGNNSSSATASSDAIADSTTDPYACNDTASDNLESDSMLDNSNGKSQNKIAKGMKKIPNKNKKKIIQKTESPAKPDDLKLIENNGILNGNSINGVKNNFPAELNGCEATATNGEFSQGCSHFQG